MHCGASYCTVIFSVFERDGEDGGDEDYLDEEFYTRYSIPVCTVDTLQHSTVLLPYYSKNFIPTSTYYNPVL